MRHYKSTYLKKICEALDLHPSEVVFVDDDKDDVLNARKEGYFALHVSGKIGFKLRELRTV